MWLATAEVAAWRHGLPVRSHTEDGVPRRRQMKEIRRTSRGRTVALCDSHPDTIDLLRTVFEEDGFRVVTIDLREVRAGRLDIARFRDRHPFDVVVFDITLPYQATWELFRQLQTADLAGVPVILTTSNERALAALLGEAREEPVVEIWGKPYDIQRLRASVLAALNLPERRGDGADRRRDAPMGPGANRREGDRRQARFDLVRPKVH
jgi:CheY-like chemotaxis protein